MKQNQPVNIVRDKFNSTTIINKNVHPLTEKCPELTTSRLPWPNTPANELFTCSEKRRATQHAAHTTHMHWARPTNCRADRQKLPKRTLFRHASGWQWTRDPGSLRVTYPWTHATATTRRCYGATWEPTFTCDYVSGESGGRWRYKRGTVADWRYRPIRPLAGDLFGQP